MQILHAIIISETSEVTFEAPVFFTNMIAEQDNMPQAEKMPATQD